MKRNNIFSIAMCLIALAFFLPYKAQSQYLSWQWVSVAHGTAAILPNDITGDNNDNVIVCGQTESARTFFQDDTLYGHGDKDIFIAKYDNAGALKWVKNPGGSGHEYASSVCTDSNNNIYITGTYRSGGLKFENDSLACLGDFDMFLAKYDPNSKQLWVRHIGGKDREIGNIVRYDPNGFIVCVWYCPGAQFIHFGIDSLYHAGPQIVTKMTTDGNLIWSKSFPVDVPPEHLTINHDGEILISGLIGNTVIVNKDTLTKGIYIAKFDMIGNLLWIKHADATRVTGLVQDLDKNIYCLGSSENNAIIFGSPKPTSIEPSFFLSKLDSQAHTVWVKNLVSSGDVAAYNMVLTGSGQLLINGSTNGSPVDFGNNLKFNATPNQLPTFIGLFDTSGIPQWIEPSTIEILSMRYQLPKTLLISGRIQANSEELGNIKIIRPFNSQGIYIAKAFENNLSSVRTNTENSNILTTFYQPRSGTVTLRSIEPLEFPCTIDIYDVLGKMVKSSTFNSGDTQKLTLGAADLSNGAYSLKITSEHQSASSKVMIVK